MKNFVVKSLIDFNDYGGKETDPSKNQYIERKINDIFECTKERYVELKEHNAVMLYGINKVVEKWMD